VIPDLSALLIIERIFNKLKFKKFFPTLLEIYIGFEKSCKNIIKRQTTIIGKKINNTPIEINLSINIFITIFIYKFIFKTF